MSSPGALYILAADHRWQIEAWCDEHGVGRDRIPEIKALIVDAFRAARARNASVAAHGALLLDEQYAGPLVRQARGEGIAVATPAEKAGAFPLEWATTPFHEALTGTIAKVLVRYRPEHAVDRVQAERDKLKTLAAWCAAHGKPLLVEVLVMRQDEDEAAFEATGRPSIIVDYIRKAYADGLVPDFWKMEGTVSAGAAAAIDAAVAERTGPRFLVLGKGAGFDLVEQWIAVARQMQTAGGFAIGRTVYWTTCTAWIAGSIARAEAIEQVATNYERLVRAWEI
jgi:5-dehydro-2-deoxygluconokinase